MARKNSQILLAVTLIAFGWAVARAQSSPGIQAEQPGAKVKFYDPAGTGLDEQAPLAQPPRLRSARFADAFPPRGSAGIHYWFEDGHGVPSTESGAAKVGGRFVLHVRNNVGNGFLTVWSMEGEGGVELTPRTFPPYPGFELGKQEYVVPGEFQFKSGAAPRSVLLVFSRSQTEQSGSPAHARTNLRRILSWRWKDSPQVISESDETTVGQVGTYVVNQVGAAVATEIIVR